jgi:DNA-binding IclR family transcriptional regulator
MSNGAARDPGVRSVERAITILDLLAQGGWRTGAEVARELHVHRSTALRLLASVVTGESDLRSVARPVCERLAASLGETVTLDVLAGDEIVPIEQATASTSVVSVNWLGRRTPVHCTASGKVIVAFGPAAVRERLLSRPLARSTPHTVTSRTELEAQLDEAIKDGFARTYEELEAGLDAIAAPVYSASGDAVAAIDVSGPSHRLRAGSRPELVQATVDAAADLSRRLGYRTSRGVLKPG